MMKNILLACVLVLVALPGVAEEKQFEREYTYRAGDDDSKNSARKSAIKELRTELLREVGVYIESYLEIQSISNADRDRDYVREEIKQITAGTVETRILDERWDGSHFFVRSIVTVDLDRVVDSVNRALERRSASAQLERMRTLLSSRNADLAARRADLANVKRRLETRKSEVEALSADTSRLRSSLESQRRELRALHAKLAALTMEQDSISSKRSRIQRKIDSASEKAETMLSDGMTVGDVVSLFGIPRSHNSCRNREHLNYGRHWLLFESGVIQCRVESRYYQGDCSHCPPRQGSRTSS